MDAWPRRPYGPGWRIVPCATAALKPRHNARMKIHLNGEERLLDDGIMLLALLASEGLADRRVAIEINGDIIPRSQHTTHALREDDRVEIVHALGGG